MNTIKINKKLYKYESLWRESKKPSYDYNNNPLPYPVKGSYWQNKEIFIEKLLDVQNELLRKNKFNKYKNFKDCLICKEKNITSGTYEIKNIRWEDGLLHYINIHNIKPSEEFLDYIFAHTIRYNTKKANIGKMDVEIIKSHNKQYLKLEQNQILIMDAMMEHGSYQKYLDKKNKNMYKFSEHAGLLDFENSGLEKIIISGNTNRIDENDKRIFFPDDLPDAYDYEYIFHTHPPTPKPGSRAVNGILYEFPSISDMFHFIEHYNDGYVQGSLIIAPEGMYNIRKLIFDDEIIDIDLDKFMMDYDDAFIDIQINAIDKYIGDDIYNYNNADDNTNDNIDNNIDDNIDDNTNNNFSIDKKLFYSIIAQDKKYINELNKITNKYDLHIDYYPRVKKNNNWIIDTVYLPIYVVEPK